MRNAVLRKLEAYAVLPQKDGEVLERIISAHIRTANARTELIREGDKPQFAKIILEGWCAKTKTLANGKRQIVSFMIPGDICDLHASLLRQMDHTLTAITDIRYAALPADAVAALVDFSQKLSRALLWEASSRESIQREWALNLGQRTAYERLAHLLCELFVRQRALGIGTNLMVPLPLTQTDLGEATGMSDVHVNRTLQELRRRKLVQLAGRRLTVKSFADLARVGMFTPLYLHFYNYDPQKNPGI